MKSLLALALTATALLAGCAAPVAIATQGADTAIGSPLYEAMQAPEPGFAKKAAQ